MKIGRKAMIAIKVAPSKGIAVCRPIAVIASIRLLPAFRSTSIPSIITIALSTSIPIASTNDASETRCIVPSTKYRNRKEPNTVTTRLIPIITPLLNPIVIIRMTTTIMTDSIRLRMNVPNEPDTRSGW